MGKPRALKQKDKVPKGLVINSNFESANKTTTFSDETEDDEKEVQVNQSKQIIQEVSEEQEDEPEEVKASSLEILQLKKQLEESINPRKSARLKRKKEQQASKIQEKQTLDEDIFNAIDEEEHKEETSNNSAPIVITSSTANPVNSHIRNFGMLEVRVLNQEEENPTKKFKLSKEVASFVDLRSSNVPRTKYGSFIAQRRPKPSRSFVVVNSKA